MASRRVAKIGCIFVTSLVIMSYLFLPDNVDTALGSSSAEKVRINGEELRYPYSLADRLFCIFEACYSLPSLEAGQLLETIFHICLSKEFQIENFAGKKRKPQTELNIVVVACGNRLEETLINIKSSLLFTKETIFFHIFAEKELHQGFENNIERWPISFKKYLEYELYPITFPDDGNSVNWKGLFKPCASQRLFLPLVIGKDVDSVLYVDTDILFLTEIREFWNFFRKFNASQLSSLCNEHEDVRVGWYNRFARHPYYGKTGLNSGVMLMNLTRMRSVKYKNDLMNTEMTWGEMLLPLYKKYKYNITWGDQDLLNIIFHYNPELLHVFTCEWNYRPDHCMYGPSCPMAASNGVKILHGSRQVYHNDKQPAFRAVYEAIKEYNFQEDMSTHLLEVMQKELMKTESTYCGKEYEIIIKGLRRSIESKSVT